VRGEFEFRGVFGEFGIDFRRLLIDTTDPYTPDYVKQLEQVLKEENSSISNIIATHWHEDHIGSIMDVKKNLVTDDCQVWKFKRSDATEDYGDLKFEELTDGQEFEVDGMKLKVLHTPGHTTDHVILYDEQNSAVFSGDCILGEGTAVFEDLFDYMKSLELILSLKPTRIYPGHSDVINDPVERIEFYIKHRNEREKQILDAITASKEPLKDMDIVKIVYTTTPRHLWPAAAKNVNQHLIKLKKEGKIVDVDKNGQVFWQAAQVNKL
jgi:endoribonuclease LACTB2